MWVCFLDDSGECWTFENPQVRIQWNITLGRVSKNTDAKAKADDDFDDPPNGKPDNAEPTQIGQPDFRANHEINDPVFH